MNALFLTYAILAVAYFLLPKKWDTKWLQQGNYLFLAIASTVTLMHDFADVVIAHYSGYLMEMLAYIEGHTGQSIFLHLFLASLIPAIGVINYARRFRRKDTLQVIIYLVVVSSLLFAGFQEESLRTYIPFYSSASTLEPGWHTVIPQAMGLLPFLITLGLSIGITVLLGKFLKRKSELEAS